MIAHVKQAAHKSYVLGMLVTRVPICVSRPTTFVPASVLNQAVSKNANKCLGIAQTSFTIVIANIYAKKSANIVIKGVLDQNSTYTTNISATRKISA